VKTGAFFIPNFKKEELKMIDHKFLEGIGITDENVVKSITEAYAADIKAEKDTAAGIQQSLDTANAAIQSYKDMDIDGIKASVEDYKQKWEQSEADRKAFEHKTKLGQYVKGLGLRDDVYEQHVTNLLMEKGLKFDGDKLIGGDDVVSAFRESHADAFNPPEPAKPFMGYTPGISPAAQNQMDKLREIYGIQKEKGR